MINIGYFFLVIFFDDRWKKMRDGVNNNALTFIRIVLMRKLLNLCKAVAEAREAGGHYFFSHPVGQEKCTCDKKMSK